MTSDRLNFLKGALQDDAAVEYAVHSSRLTLTDIGFSPSFIHDVHKLLISIKELSSPELSRAVQIFRSNLKSELLDIYSRSYFETRYDFLEDYIPGYLKSFPIESSLDLGCGEGFFGQWLARHDIFHKILGWDLLSFPESWRGLSSRHPHLEFSSSKESSLGQILEQTSIDSVFLMWVLHHATATEVEDLVQVLYSKLSKGTLIFVLEDALMSAIPADDFFNLDPIFRGFACSDRGHLLPSGRHAHGILDFLAVRVLAGYSTVPLRWNYRTGEDWIECFKKAGFQVLDCKFLGFPNNRDIAVPQTLLVLLR